MTQPETTTFGKYRILERVASGGMAEIFKARLEGIGGFHRTFAIKRILPHLTSNLEFVDLLVDEAKVAGLLSHANIVQILDLGRIDEHYFIAMEYVKGHDLGEVMKRCLEKGITLPVPHAVFICIEVLKGLEYAHKRQVMRDGRPVPLDIVHRDISPSNMLVSNQGEVKITDFGMAKASVKALETIDGVIKGRFDYLDAAQAEGRGATQQSDLFSLGVVFYEMLVGDHPFRRDTDMATLEAVRSGQFEPASFVNMDIPPQLDDVIARALSPDPSQRYADATAFKEDLDRFFHESEFIFTQSTLAAFLKGLFPEHKKRSRPGRLDAPVRPLEAQPPPPLDDFDEDILPTVVKANPLGQQVSPFEPAKPKLPAPRNAPRPSAASSIHEAATMLRRIPDASAANPFAQPAGMGESATLIRANPLLDGGELGEAETQIKRQPAFDGRPLDASSTQVLEEDPFAAMKDRPTLAREDLDRPTLAREDLDRPTVASPELPLDPDSESIPHWAGSQGDQPKTVPHPGVQEFPPQAAPPPPRPAPAPPAPALPAPPAPRPAAPQGVAPIPPHQPVAAAPQPRPVAPQARVQMRSIMGYMLATFVFAGILGAMVGFVGGIIITQKVLEGRTIIVPAGPASVTFVLPVGATLELDGEQQAGGPTLQRELAPDESHQVRVLIEGQPPMSFPLSLTAGEHRTVLIPGAVTE